MEVSTFRAKPVAANDLDQHIVISTIDPFPPLRH